MELGPVGYLGLTLLGVVMQDSSCFGTARLSWGR